jgi:small subunit ribosomal protein S13
MEKEKNNQEKHEHRVVRILSKDIEGRTTVYTGLTKINGVSWALSNAICKIAGIDKKRTIGILSEKEIEKIISVVKNPENFPKHLLNRRRDLETNSDQHLIGGDLDLKKEFDIKRIKKIRSYKGIRHGAGLPVNGQRTKGNFRSNKIKGMGIKKK